MLAILLTIFSSIFVSPEFKIDSVILPITKELDADSISTNPSDSIENRYVEIDNIFIIGNKRTKERIILRELSIQVGQMIFLPDLKDHIELDKSKILNTRLFNAVELSILELSPEKIDIVIRVEERWYTFPIPIFELVDRNFNDWWVNRNHDINRLKYGIRFNQNNMRGANERLRVIAQFGIERRFGLSYSIPYIDKGQKHGVQIQANYKENINQKFMTKEHNFLVVNSEKVLFQQTSAEIKYTFRGQFYIFHDISVEYSQSKINDTINKLNPEFFKNGNIEQKLFGLSYSFKQDKRDFVSYPLKGYRAEVIIMQKGLGIFNDANKFSFDASFAKHIDVGKKFYLSNFSNIYLSTPIQQSYSLYQGLGYGSKLVRGYETYVIEGNNSIVNKTTFKKNLVDEKFNLVSFIPNQFRKVPFAIYLKSFFDFGYVSNYPNYELNTRLTNTWIFSGGMGIDIVTYYDFVVRLEYSLNAQNEYWFNFDLKKEF